MPEKLESPVPDPLLTRNGIGAGRAGRKQRKIRRTNGGKKGKSEPKRLRFVRHSAASAVSLVLLEARLGGKPGLQIEPELVLYGPDGSESAACRRIYHRQE